MNTGKADPEEPPATNPHEQGRVIWGVPARAFNRWPALLAILIAIGLYVTLPSHLYYGPWWVLPAIEGALFVALLTARRVEDEGYEWQRATAIALTAAMSLANLGSLALLIHNLVTKTPIHGEHITALHLMTWAAQIWLTNVIVFGLWYWELDRGGPVARTLPRHRTPDFLFPQMATPGSAPADWNPSFFDYIYTSFTNAAAFSPTDTMPMTEWAKALFMIQSFASLTTAVLVVARIANILP
jgi:hypothetical protein